jgi:tetratricopeptide (TPR) repeat protein
MRFTEGYRTFGLALGVVLLASCSVVSDKTQERSEHNQQSATTNKELNDDLSIDHLLVQPNRYLDHKKSVAATIKREFDLALTAKKSGQLDNAQKALLNITVSEPGLSGPWVQLGDIASERAQQTKEIIKQTQLLEKAAVQYHQALLINPNNYHAHNRLARVYRQQGKFELALTHYQKAVDSWPAFALAYKNRGILYDLYLGDKTRAINNYRLYLALMDAQVDSDSDGAAKPSLAGQQRQVKGWISDLSRQIQQERMTNVKQDSEVAHHVR